jgi:hypothetical protein
MKRRQFVQSMLATTGLVAASGGLSSLAMAETLEHELAKKMKPENAGQPMAEHKTKPKHEMHLWVPTEPRMPAAPTLMDFFKNGRFANTADHCLQSATRAKKNNEKEETIFACLIHDLSQDLVKSDHGWWGAQLFTPYVSERVSWSLRHHQALRFFPDKDVGYEYPEIYKTLFGENYVPEPYLQAAYNTAKKHKWYMWSRKITLNDDYSFQQGVKHSIDEFADVIGRQFKQPKDGLGFDNSPVAHMWRTLINPTRPL